jgi:hypothetical protein
MGNKIQCVSSFIDIGRSSWNNNYSRSTERYINNFLDFYSNIEIDLILFCEDNFKNEIKKRIDQNFKTSINFQTIERDNIEYFKLVDDISNIQKHSTNMIEYKRRDSTNPPEYSNAHYVAMMYAKSEFIKMALDRNLIETNNVAWIDFGIGHGEPSYIAAIKNKTLINPESDKMIFFNRQNIEPSIDPFFYSKLIDNVLICGGFYIIPKKLIIHFYNEFRKIVDTFTDLHIIDDDQTILSILTASNLDFCNVISSSKYRNNPNAGDWFPVFEFIK